MIDGTDDIIKNEATVWILTFYRILKWLVAQQLFKKWPGIDIGFHRSASGKFRFKHLQALTNPSVNESSFNSLEEVGTVREQVQ